MEMKAPSQTGRSALYVQLSSHSDEVSLSDCQGAHDTSASRLQSSTDKALSDIVLPSKGNRKEGRAVLQNFLNAS